MNRQQRSGVWCEHKEGDYHDCDYVDARNLLLKRAEAIADTATDRIYRQSGADPDALKPGGTTKKYGRWASIHSRQFCLAMERLAREYLYA